MALEDMIEFLERVPSLHVLGRKALRILAISAVSVDVQHGDILFEEGEPADSGYVVLDGAIMLRSARGRSAGESAVARSGTLIGEMALIVDTSRPATATATEQSTVLRIPREVFLRMLESEPGAAAALKEMIVRRVDAVLNDLDLAVPLFESSDDPRAPDLR